MNFRSPALSLTRQSGLVVGLLVVAGVSWLVVGGAMRSMPMADDPGSPVDALVFIGVWVAMMAAMMLPAAMPMMLVYSVFARSRALTAVFACGYLAVWSAVGLVVYTSYSAVHGGLLTIGGVDGFDRPAAALALVAAGAYQLSPLKNACLARCRAPLAQIARSWRDGAGGALRMGAGHGAWCVGCCAGLMLVLLAVGAMSLFWMVAVTLVIVAEKTMPFGVWASRAVAVVLALFAILVAAGPGGLPA